MTTVDSMQSCGHSKYDCRFDCLTCLQFTVNELNGRVSKALQSQTVAESQLGEMKPLLDRLMATNVKAAMMQLDDHFAGDARLAQNLWEHVEKVKDLRAELGKAEAENKRLRALLGNTGTSTQT